MRTLFEVNQQAVKHPDEVVLLMVEHQLGGETVALKRIALAEIAAGLMEAAFDPNIKTVRLAPKTGKVTRA